MFKLGGSLIAAALLLAACGSDGRSLGKSTYNAGSPACRGKMAGDACDSVVDGRCDAGVGLVGVREHGCRQWSNGDRKADPEDEQSGEEIAKVGRVHARPQQQEDAPERLAESLHETGT